MTAALRRPFDVVAAAAGLVVLAPFMLAVAIAIRLGSPGPALFRQLRLGRDGRPFYLYKFRKFEDRADSGRAVTLKNDPRMTRIGRLLERTKLDELPQLWNILIGDMSLVGPRPETLNFADCFREGYQRVLDYTPGLFGPSQAMFRNESGLYPADRDPEEFYRAVLFPTKARIDLVYFSRRSILSDIRWIIRGILAVLRDKDLKRVEDTENWLRPERRTEAMSVVEERN
jgi:lipopolysaccharide/colanic/teichoic acid biosynthesis glycosyltransferase